MAGLGGSTISDTFKADSVGCSKVDFKASYKIYAKGILSITSYLNTLQAKMCTISRKNQAVVFQFLILYA